MSRGAGKGSRVPSKDRRKANKSKPAKRRPSSARWLRRQLSDPYVAQAARHGYRSRAAWKLIEIDDRFGILAPGKRVVDLGAAPGGWTQVAVQRVKAAGRKAAGSVVALDLNEMDPVPGAQFVRLDVCDPASLSRIEALLDGKADVVLSDMAAPATGHRATDHMRSIALCETAHHLARGLLASDGALVVKMLDGGEAEAFHATLKREFLQVKTIKPPASRAQSAETYVLAAEFREPVIR